jgi:hypothetical protein
VPQGTIKQNLIKGRLTSLGFAYFLASRMTARNAAGRIASENYFSHKLFPT